MVRREDRVYAGGIAAVLYGARIIKTGMPSIEQLSVVAMEVANASAAIIAAVDRHLSNDDRERVRTGAKGYRKGEGDDG